MFELLLWAPQSWFTHTEPPCRSEVAKWLRSVAIQFILEVSQNRISTNVEDCLKMLFLARLNLDQVYGTVCLMSSLAAWLCFNIIEKLFLYNKYTCTFIMLPHGEWSKGCWLLLQIQCSFKECFSLFSIQTTLNQKRYVHIFSEQRW